MSPHPRSSYTTEDAVRLFTEADLSQVMQHQHASMQEEVEKTKDAYLLNVNETEFVEYLAGRYRIEPVELNVDGLYATDCEKQIPAEQHSSLFFVQAGETYPRQVITYHLPFSGDPNLLRCRASTF